MEETTSIKLGETYLEQAIQDTHFFNGRLLTAGDLVQLQEASRLHDHQLGRALGEGVAYGLQVRLKTDGSDGEPPVLVVSKGLAINRLGQAIALAQDAEVMLERKKPEPPPPSGYFQLCAPPQQGGQPVPGKGAYLLLVRPALSFRGLAPRRGFGQAARVEGCDRDLLIEGAQFRLAAMDVNELLNLSATTRGELVKLLAAVEAGGGDGLAARNKLRNWLAHACFGTEELQGWLHDPFAREADSFFGAAVRSPFDRYGAVDELRSQCVVDDCDVPLALLCWTRTGVQWVDMWSVRRRLVRPVLSTAWPLPLAHRHRAARQAAFLQFQNQVQSLYRSRLSNFALSSIRALDYFRYLPAAGVIPLQREGARGFEFLNFSAGLTLRDRDSLERLPFPDRFYIEGAKLESLVQDSLTYPPIDLEQNNLIWFYLVRHNIQANDEAEFAPPPAYAAFSSGHMPFRGDARLDLARFSYANHASIAGHKWGTSAEMEE